MKLFARPRILVLGVLASATLAVIWSCGSDDSSSSDDDDGAATTPSASSAEFQAVYDDVISVSNCATCHIPDGEAFVAGVELDLTSATKAFDSLTSMASTYENATVNCEGAAIVTAGSPTSSYLLAVISPSDRASFSSSDAASCEPVTTHDGRFTALDADQIAAVKTWINSLD